MTDLFVIFCGSFTGTLVAIIGVSLIDWWR